MKRVCLSLLCCLGLLLSGCGSSLQHRCQSCLDTLRAQDSFSFTAKLRAEYEDSSFSCVLDYAGDAGGGTVTVTEPEILRGICARFSSDTGALEFEGLLLDTGALDEYGLTPVSALPILANALRCGYLDSCWSEEDCLVMQLVPDDVYSVMLWIEEGSLLPCHAQLVSDGRVRIFCDITNWN